MKTSNSGRLFKAWKHCGIRRLGLAAMAGLMTLASHNGFAQATVATLTDANHGQAGYRDGNTFAAAQFSFPAGIALDPSGTVLFLADYNNNAVRMVTAVGDTSSSFTYSAFTTGNGFSISHPRAVAVDANTNVYVLNQGSGTNGTVLKFNGSYFINYQVVSLISTNASRLTNATSLALDTTGNIYVTVNNNTVIRIVPNSGTNPPTVVGIITNTGTSLRGIVVLQDGRLALTDGGNNGIWMMDPSNTNLQGNATKLTGFNGAGDVLGPPAFAAFNGPENIVKAGNGILVVSDYNNHKVKIVDASGTVTRLYGVKPQFWSASYPGWRDGTVNPNEPSDLVDARQPFGLAIGNNGTVYATETFYNLLRKATGTGLPALPPPPPPAPTIWSATPSVGQVTLTWSPVNGATNYHVKRSTSPGGTTYTTIAITAGTSYIDTSVSGGTTYYYAVSAVNAGGEGQNSSEVAVSVPLPPVPDPKIGYVDFPFGLSSFHQVSTVVLNNDELIVILGAAGTQTYYTFGNTPLTTNDPAIPDPTSADNSAMSGYMNGLDFTSAAQFAIAGVRPDLTVKAVGKSAAGNPDSAVVSARFQFITANPVISGGNAAAFTLSDITAGAHLFYTLDGTDPSSTNGIDLGTVASVTNTWSISLGITSNTLFKVRAFKSNYQPSAVVSNLFTVAGFLPNTITFGRSSGEPYSKFVARPGQYFYAPVTLNLAPGFTKMYSLQFNVTVTNGFTNIISGSAIPPVVVNTNSTDFFSMLMTKVTPDEGRYFPPADGSWYLTLPPLRAYFTGGNTNIISSTFVNSNNNLLGVGWIFRTGFDYFYTDTAGNVILDFKTGGQDLITYSIVHDTLFNKSDGLVVVGAYAFQVPSSATNGDQYFIQLGSPSGTSDGVGAPGADIFIASPALSQAVTVGTPAYVVGDAAPFHWLNAGDFGDGTLDSSDVMQTYQTAIVNVDMPPTNSDLYLAMDSSGGIGAFDSVNNYYTNAGTATFAQQQAMWDGNDQFINTNAFGDGVLDINDLFVTFRRSLDPSLLWFKRFWTNGQFVAVTTPNLAYNTNAPHALVSQSVQSKVAGGGNYQQSFVTFKASDATATAGQTVQIPIYAQVNGDYPLRVLGLNLNVVPLDGSPAITQPVTFTPAAGLGNPSLPPITKGAASFAAVWLDNTISGLNGNSLVGTLTVTLPANATSSSVYAVHFNHASGSPNGLALFPKQTLTGLITLSSRTNSCYNDGIPDSWRLRWFGTVNNILTASNACPSGDGVNNWMKYIAGVDPNAAGNFPKLNAKTPSPSGMASIHWPTVSGKQYVIERSATLFPAAWTSISTNTGTGADMEFDDSYNGGAKFYRVRILP